MLGASITLVSALLSPAAHAQTEVKLGDKKTRRTPALRARVYEQLARAQAAGDAGNIEEAIEILDIVKSKQSSMNSYERAKEDKKAVPVMQMAAELSDDGEIDAQLALLHFNLEEYEQAIASANTALEKGGLDNAGNTHMVLGLALYNTRQFALALDELAKAESFSGSRAAARQWTRYVEREKSDFAARQAINADS
ncbi:hypothetical protein PN836_008755 [Ningiella sp. W23]|uniref:hypothetical protein n=1 Tax=Ningiella sp. W23 TaxID=3023715 RepID=UPI0037580D10